MTNKIAPVELEDAGLDGVVGGASSVKLQEAVCNGRFFAGDVETTQSGDDEAEDSITVDYGAVKIANR